MKSPHWLKLWRIRRKIQRFQKAGARPWTPGYEEYKEQEIGRILKSGCFDPEHLPPHFGIGVDERIVEIPWFFQRIPPGPARLLDAGSALNQELYLTQPVLAEKEIQIVTLAPENYCAWRSGVSYLFHDLRQLPYRDAWFDQITCISTLEHIGMDNTLLYTAESTYREHSPGASKLALVELFRVLRPGGKLWLSVPVGRPKDLGWLQIFDSRTLESMISTSGFSLAGAWYYQYTRLGWQRARASQVTEATYFDWNHTKIHDPDMAAAARAVGCFELFKQAV